MGKKTMCCGCGEQSGTIKAEGLGFVCELCNEVLPLVYANEVEKVREAIRNVERFLAQLEETST